MQSNDPIRIAAIVDGHSSLPLGARSALDAICNDARFRLTDLITHPAAKSNDPAVSRIVQAVDSALFARPRQCNTPAFDAARDTLVLTSASEITEGRTFDVVLDFSTAGAPETLRDISRHGLWRLTSFDTDVGFVGTPPVVEVDLYRHADSKTPPRRMATAVYNVKISAARTAAFVREKSVQLLVRELKRLAIAGAPADMGSYDPPIRSRRGAAAAVDYSLRFARALIGRGIERVEEVAGFRPGMFCLRYGRGGPLDFDPLRAIDIVPAGNRYWADPFLFEHGGDLFVFFEDYAYGARKGHIGVGKFTDGQFSMIGPALTADYHLSYPFVFSHAGEIFMAPETNQTRRLEIWRCTKFPDAWELHATALEGVPTADSVLFQHNGDWWLFTNISADSYGDHCTELHIFRADGPMLRSLEPHPLNPVVIDARTARGGGRIIVKDGRLLRISQDNAYGTYGYGLNVMEIIRLDAQDYSERLVRKITPDFEEGLIGCHHADFAGDAFVMDVRRRRGGRSRRK